MTGIIPARGGSKRLPGKNIKEFAGFPLIAWTIRAAELSGCFSRIIVSTDCLKIGKVAEAYGAEVPFLRDEEFSGDCATSESVIFDIADRLDLIEEDVIGVLQPTSPLRDATDIKAAMKLYSQGDVDSVISVCPFKLDQKWLMDCNDRGFLAMRKRKGGASDEELCGEAFFPNGALYITNIKSLRKFNVLVCGNVRPFIMSSLKSIDIDTEDDFEMAQFAMTRFFPKRMEDMQHR